MKSLVSFFEIPAVDFKRAVKFYETVFNINMPCYECDHEKMAFFPEENKSYPGAISWADAFKPYSDGVLISLNCNDINQTLELIKINGGKIITPKTKISSDNRGYFAIFIDSEGNRVGLYSD